MGENYFNSIYRETPTRMWINNPTINEAIEAIKAGAINCTTNPTYAAAMVKSTDEHENAIKEIDRIIERNNSAEEYADLVQQRLVKRLLDIFLPVYEKNEGAMGFVSIQGNPYKDDRADSIINEAINYSKLGKNFIAKIPVTEAGLKAIDHLIRLDMPIIATEIMAVSQAVKVCELYKKVSEECGNRPPFFVTHITGILDEYFANQAKLEAVEIAPEILAQAGTIIAKKQYRLMKERKYPGTMLGGGARKNMHFTGMTGGDIHITINWSMANELIKSNSPYNIKFDTAEDKNIVNELCGKLDDFRRAYYEDALGIDEYKEFGPVEYFREKFIEGWDFLTKAINSRQTEV